MAGHSHWVNIAHKKALVDNKRGKLWSKFSKAIILAAKIGGGDADANLKLRYAIDAAKAVSMPKDTIQRAIKRGTGELRRQPGRSAVRRLRMERLDDHDDVQSVSSNFNIPQEAMAEIEG